MAEKKTRTLAVRVSEIEAMTIENIASIEDRRPSEIIRFALRDYVARWMPPVVEGGEISA